MKITWTEADNAPGCAGRIVAEDGRDILVQTDWDYPATAQTFGWSLRESQVLNANYYGVPCEHRGTDGTTNCPDCGYPASAFICDAAEWLADSFGAEADDPGYFTVLQGIADCDLSVEVE